MLRGIANVVLLGLLFGSLCWAGGQTEPVPAAEPSAAMAATKYQEAPMLSALVRAGKLPPVDERLPAEPLVVEPLEEIGQYGGTWSRATRAKSSWAFWGYVIKQNEIRYTPDFQTIVPHIFQDYEVADGNRTFTFHLREGLRWSDGAVSSADDFEFWWNDLVLNDDYTPVKPQDFMLAKELATFTRVDDHTIQLGFSQPNTLFLDRLARPRVFSVVQPSHYGKQFHPSYLEKADLDALLKDGGYDTWVDLMQTKLLFFGNPELPQLIAWVPLDDNTGAIQRFERNPYFWKVDTANNQLPYIDRVETVFTPDTQTTLLKAMAGDIDMQYREMGGADDFSLLMQNAEKGDYRIINTATAMHNTHTHVFNYTHPDPVIRELFLDKRFRVALSIAINREELNNLLHKGLNEIQAAASVTPGDVSYDERVTKLYTQYDPDRANELLDEMGLEWDQDRKFRLRPDGKPLRFTNIYFTGAYPPKKAEATELIKGYWEAIGVESIPKGIERAAWVQRIQGGEYEIANEAWGSGGLAYNPIFAGLWSWDIGWMPAGPWALWYGTNGASGEEPPPELKPVMDRFHEIYNEVVTLESAAERSVLIQEAIELINESVLAIGVLSRSSVAIFFVVKNNFRNVPDHPSDDVTYYHPSSFFFKQ